MSDKTMTLQLTNELCRRCDEPFRYHHGIEHYCPMYCTFQGRAPSPLREPSETPEDRRGILDVLVSATVLSDRACHSIADKILAAGFRRSALPVETPDIPLRPVSNKQIAARIAETIQWEDHAPHEWNKERWDYFIAEATLVLDGAEIAEGAMETRITPNRESWIVCVGCPGTTECESKGCQWPNDATVSAPPVDTGDRDPKALVARVAAKHGFVHEDEARLDWLEQASWIELGKTDESDNNGVGSTNAAVHICSTNPDGETFRQIVVGTFREAIDKARLQQKGEG